MDINVLTSIPSTPASGRSYFVIGVHDGFFHEDDTSAVAFLCMLHSNEKIIIVRSRDIDILNKCDIVVDIGGGKFDHHMPGFDKKRSNGITYASAGLIWQVFGEQVIQKFLEKSNLLKELSESCSTIVETIDKEIVQYIDAKDNGIDLGTHDISFISSYLPAWYENKPDFEKQFSKALNITLNVLEQKIQQIISETYAEKVLRERVKNVSDYILEIPSQTFPWLKAICNINKYDLYVAFVIFPYPAGGWAAQCVPPSLEEKFDQIAPFPQKWAGQTELLPDISGIKGALGCHRLLFFAKAETKEEIIQMCILAMK